MSSHRPYRCFLLCLLLPLAQCSGDDVEAMDLEEEGESTIGKADGSSFSPCVAAAMLAFLNEGTTDYAKLRTLKISTSPAKGIIAHRDGPDGAFGTSDDDLYDTLLELDKVKWVGPIVMGRIATEVESKCQAGTTDVVFSPQSYTSSHLPRIVQIIDATKRSLDIAMYNLTDSGIKQALQRATQRGVEVRFLSEDAHADASSPAGSKSAALEALGVNVRYVNKIMHHKSMIADGPRDDVSTADTAWLATGSANWSNGAATSYDENTVLLSGLPRVVLAYQAEFNRLWEHSSDFVGDATLPYDLSIALDPATFPADPSCDALFTSSNFSVKAGSTTFKDIVGSETISAALVKEIQNAQVSIHIASGHLRSRPVAEALIAAKAAKPQLDIKVYLDQQEYISQSGHADQIAELNTCLAAAGSDPAKQQDCKDTGFLFSNQVSQAGIALRFKFYAYRWDYTYAKQMHNKYFIFDGKTLITGSYNLSDNAEHNTFENMLVLRAPTHSALIARFETSFASIWNTDASGSLLATLKSKITSAPSIPLVFAPMALTWQQVSDLKQLIATNCPAVNSVEYRQNAASHTYCPRQ